MKFIVTQKFKPRSYKAIDKDYGICDVDILSSAGLFKEICIFSPDQTQKVINNIKILDIEMGQEIISIKGIQTDGNQYWYQEVYLRQP